MPRFYSLPIDEAKALLLPEYNGTYQDRYGVIHHTWLIWSDTSDLMYAVDLNTKTAGLRCTCKASEFKRQCKHLVEVASCYNIPAFLGYSEKD